MPTVIKSVKTLLIIVDSVPGWGRDAGELTVWPPTVRARYSIYIQYNFKFQMSNFPTRVLAFSKGRTFQIKNFFTNQV